jgi:hypothetical protein
MHFWDRGVQLFWFLAMDRAVGALLAYDEAPAQLRSDYYLSKQIMA